METTQRRHAFHECTDTQTYPRMLSDSEVEQLTGLKRKQRLKMEATCEFPCRVPLSPRITAYLESEVLEWIEQRVADRGIALAKRHSPNPLAKANRKALVKGGAS